MKNKVLVIEGDGIGLEIIAEARKVLEAVDQIDGLGLEYSEGMLGGLAYDAHGHPYPDDTRQKAADADAILFGALGGPKWDGTVERHLRPEQGLLDIRSHLGLFANFRPALTFPQLAEASSLKPELVAGLDILILRELTGGIYFGEPRGVRVLENRLCSVDKANVLDVTVLWREIVTEIGAEYPDVELSHMYADNAAMQLVGRPKQFDVIVTGNLFGDILSDVAAMLTGSIGMLPSASLDLNNKGFYEPVHGSAPDIAGQNMANPLAAILSAAMMLRYSLDAGSSADRIEAAVTDVLQQGLRTADIYTAGTQKVGTVEMGDAVVAALKKA